MFDRVSGACHQSKSKGESFHHFVFGFRYFILRKIIWSKLKYFLSPTVFGLANGNK